MTVCAITLNWNGADDTKKCLASLAAQAGVSCHSLVVDNGSTDDSRAHLQDTEVIATGRNLGFCGGNNLAIAQALEENWDYVFLVNNDTVMEPDCLQKLVQCSEENPNAAVVCPAIFFEAERDRPWFTGGAVDWVTGAVSHVTAVDAQTHYETDWASGCAMLIPAVRLRALGGFDERFFCYYEDADWCLRARNAGHPCFICPGARLYHKVGRTSNRQGQKKYYYSTRNHLLFLQQHAPGGQFREAVRCSLRRIGREARRQNALAHLLGVLDFRRGCYGPCPYPWL